MAIFQSLPERRLRFTELAWQKQGQLCRCFKNTMSSKLQLHSISAPAAAALNHGSPSGPFIN